MKNRLIAVLLAACAAFCARGDTWTDSDTGIEWTYFVSNGEASFTLKFGASGAVTAGGKFVTGQDKNGKDIVYSASCSTVLVPDAAGTRDACPYLVFLYFPPKAGKFDGYGVAIPLEWDGDGKKFIVVEP